MKQYSHCYRNRFVERKRPKESFGFLQIYELNQAGEVVPLLCDKDKQRLAGWSNGKATVK